MGRQGVRAAWDAVPPSVRAAVDDIAGSPVVRATNLDGGFSPGPAARCDLADGSTVSPDGQTWCRIPVDGTTDLLDAWCVRHLDRLVELEAGWPVAARGDTLQHHDLGTDNMLLRPDGSGVAVDWPGATYAAPWVDLAGLLPPLHLDGGPPPWEVFDTHPLGSTADPEAVDAYVASPAGFFVRSSLLPPPPGLPTVRAFQAAQGAVTCEWLARRRRWT